MALVGLDRFRQRFAAHQDSYLLIGGTACMVAMGEVGIEFRATKDLDIVLCLERVAPTFALDLWSFIGDGGYQQRETAGGREYFRFAKPSQEGYPAMLELFARAPDSITVGVDQRIIPAIRTLDASGEQLNLSAILLDDAYYDWMCAGRLVIDQLPIVRAEHLIPLKARAWIDLSERQRQGARIDQRDIKKHRNDVLRLTAIIDPAYSIEIPAQIRTDMTAFVAGVQQDPPDLLALGISGVSMADVVGLIQSRYCS